MNVVDIPKKQSNSVRISIMWDKGDWVSEYVCKDFGFSAIDNRCLYLYEQEIQDETMPSVIVNLDSVQCLTIEAVEDGG